MNTFIQYLKETRSELRHVAWPTQTQTIVYTIFVALISVATALYLGLFDFLFTSGVSNLIKNIPATSPIEITQTTATTTEATTSAPALKL